MPTISIVINCDTRPEKTNADRMFSGVCNTDFLTDGIRNKQKFFEGFDFETIVFIDEHIPVEEKILAEIREIADTVVIREHTSEPLFNDINYFSALALARGEYIAKFDQDSAAFTSSKEPILKIINLLENVDYVSYPSHWSPRAVSDDSFNYDWASTRFFMCKRSTIDFTELIKCRDYDYWRTTYPVSRVCPWTEHWLGSIAKFKGKGVFYPPMDIDNYCIFSWSSYSKYTLRRLNNLTYSEIRQWLNHHPILYPNDVNA